MTKYTLTYFDVEALGEPIRMLLSYGNLDFTDNRIDFEKDWAKFKAAMPMGQVPILEADGKIMYQSLAISRYLARLVGLYGENPLEDYEVDNAVDNINDFRAKLAGAQYEQNAVAKEEKFKLLKAETIPYFLEKLDAIAAENDGHFALKKFTWADVYFTGMSNYLSVMAQEDITANYPNLKKVIENTVATPGIKEWVEKRPKPKV
uniref:glutathione transferase n=1 Tax=Chironomus tentans TaxID=7153 RepID=C3V9U7_CHITE|nr:glutathione S-transferase [Chironomus tentans]